MSDIQLAPAPWKLKGRSWVFPVSGLKDNTSFPAGWATEYQAEALSSGGEFIGGLGTVQVVSYSESPVGPYDELIYVPGRWKYANGTKAFRVTQIYVSSKESTLNGRRNWNIPKHVAKFSITTDASQTTNIAVTHPNASAPFFKASVRRIPVLSSLSAPASTTLLGSYFSLMQPPLPAGPNPEDVATDKWASLTPTLRGSTSIHRVVPELESGTNAGKVVGDGQGFPAIVPWSTAFMMDHLVVDFGVPTFHGSI
ncbi:hypothetical protein MIND_00144400 [Mycena indigotica]|uniref:Acetoacetate decarboxylase n=1 Tax=Mycena indigotica TaxID=2126181 RepID=A0A8H6TCV6_9AGAR|nr:uncharacterized protein MIND_00144400 [Mycena indigotica]KAF7316258.1 hypothetical protein MIND_00144400 [Mycena indigotica]